MGSEVPALSVAKRQLIVRVGGESYVLPGDSLVEVLRRPRVTRVPHGPQALLGVSNLRGAVLPIVSLARLMNGDPGDEDRVVVLDHGGLVGLLVDTVVGINVAGAFAGQPIDISALLETGFRRETSRPGPLQGLADTGQTAVEVAIPQRQLVAFRVGGQTFALPLAAVTEVLRLPEQISRVAGADQAVLGLANIRDHSLPIVSLAGVLGFSDVRRDDSGSRILIVDHEGGRIGLVADAIETILRLDETAIDKVPAILQRGRGQAELDAIGRQGGGKPLVTILSVPRLFANAAVEASVGASGGETKTMVHRDTTQAHEQFVVFELGEERYGLPIAAVQEILRLPEAVTRLPNGPRFVSGIINLRGRPVPIIDQRQRFEAPVAADAVRPRVIIVTVGGLRAGFVVDAVSEILSVSHDDLAATPPLSSERSAVFTRVANVGSDGSLILLINPEELLSRAEQDVIADIAAKKDLAGEA